MVHHTRDVCCSKQLAADMSPDRVELLRHNAGVYGAGGRIEAHCSDFWQTAAWVKVGSCGFYSDSWCSRQLVPLSPSPQLGSPYLVSSACILPSSNTTKQNMAAQHNLTGVRVRQADVVFLSPPWGGIRYLNQPAFSVSPTLGSMGVSLAELLAAAHRMLIPAAGNGVDSSEGISSEFLPGGPTLPNLDSASGKAGSAAGVLQQRPASSRRRGVVAFLPKNADLRQLSQLALEDTVLEVERAVLDGFLKGITVYFWD